MHCPFCSSSETEVYNSRPTRVNTQIWRRRRCLACKETFSTYEQIDITYINIIKSEGQHQSYNRAQLYASLLSVNTEFKPDLVHVNELVNTIESKLIKLRQANIYMSQFRQAIASTLSKYDFALFMAYTAQHTRIQTKSELKEILRNT